MTRKGFATPFILIVILIIIAVGYGAYYLGRWQTPPQIINITPTPIADNNIGGYALRGSCNTYGSESKDKFLPSYVTQKGDSLLAIAKRKLSDVSKVNEIIILNNDRYPSLSLSNPFIEIGWVLFLPPPGVTGFQFDLAQVTGEISKLPKGNGEQRYGFRIPNGLGSFTLTPAREYSISPDLLKVGDCVKMLMETNTGNVYKLTYE